MIKTCNDKMWVHQEDTIVINIYVSTVTEHQFTWKKSHESRKRQAEKMVAYINAPLSIMDRTIRQKMKEISDLAL